MSWYGNIGNNLAANSLRVAATVGKPLTFLDNGLDWGAATRGANELYTRANNITNPNVNWKGDPNPVNTNNNKAAGNTDTDQTTSDTSNTNGRVNTTSSSSADRAATLAYLGLQQSNLDRQMGRTGTTLEQGLTRISNDYADQFNTGQRNQARALEDLGIQRSDTDASKDKALDKVNTNARVLADSLRRKIGLSSGSGSSAYQITAPGAVARDASTERGDVLGTFAQNYRSLDQADKRTKEDYEKLFSDLQTQRSNSELSLRQGVENTRNDISQKLADVAAQRVAANGGGLTQQMAATRGYEQDIAGREAVIDNLFNQYVKPLALMEVQAQKPELAQYLVDRAAIQANQAAGTNDPTAPYGPNLKKQFEDDQIGY